MLRDCIDEYLDDCYGLAPRTQALYARHLRIFLSVVGDQPVQTFNSPRPVRSFLAHLKRQDGKDYSPAYMHQVYRTLRTFFYWCVRQEYLPSNPMQKIRPPRVPKTKSPRLSQEEIDRTFDTALSGNTPERDMAMLLLMLDSGLRRKEVVGLELENVDWAKHTAIVYAKGKEREVPLGALTLQALRAYLAVRPETESGQVFLSTHGTPLTIDGINTWMYRLRKRSGVERLRCHILRHTFANTYLAKGGSIRRLQEVLGHSDIHTTAALYTNPEFNEIQEEHSRVSPMSDYTLPVSLEAKVSFPS